MPLMKLKRSLDYIREFPQNGMKFLLENSGYFRDLLQLLEFPSIDRIVFEEAKLETTEFIQGSFKRRLADLLIQAPFRLGRNKPSSERIDLFALIEHQSTIDRLMSFRLYIYVAQVYDRQLRQWLAADGTEETFVPQPVVPIVLYTGDTDWSDLPTMGDLVAGFRFVGVKPPEVTPLILNLGGLTSEQLAAMNNSFADILRLWKARESTRPEFTEVFRETLQRLQKLAEDDLQRYAETLHYLTGLLYHCREEAEHDELKTEIEQAPQSEAAKEIPTMIKRSWMTAKETDDARAEAKGEAKARRQILIRQLTKKFTQIPPEIISVIENQQNVDKLNDWLDAFVTANSLEEVGIQS